jgi:CheY-like chemotaxis protein
MVEFGPLVIVEDDIDDQEIVEDLLDELEVPNKKLFFDRGEKAIEFLKSTTERPFIILCDINLPQITGLDLPQITGLEFKAMIDNDPYLRQLSIPFIFFSTAAPEAIVTKAYTSLTVQGFFQKSGSVDEIKKALSIIIDYWKLSKHPNT